MRTLKKIRLQYLAKDSVEHTAALTNLKPLESTMVPVYPVSSVCATKRNGRYRRNKNKRKAAMPKSILQTSNLIKKI